MAERRSEEDEGIHFPSFSVIHHGGSASVSFLILLILSGITGGFSQQYYPRPFYPYLPTPLSPPPPPPLPPLPPVPTPQCESSARAVATAVGVTFVATLALSGLAFLLLLRFWKPKEKKKVGPPLNDGFVRVSGDLKGVLVDEYGLDVLYLKDVENGGDKGRSFKKQSRRSEQEEEKRVTRRETKKTPPVQELPLLPGKSSASDSPIWAEKTAPPLPPSSLGPAKSPPSSEKNDGRFEGDMTEALFGYVAKNRNSAKDEAKAPPSSQSFSILDQRKSEETAALLNSLGVTRKEIMDALIEGQGLSTEAIEKVVKMAPSQEEASRIAAFNGNVTGLPEAESFLHHLLKAVPSAFARFNAMLFQATFESEISQAREFLQSLESACAELRSRGVFLKLLEGILKAGNKLGSAQSLNITALRKLSDLKSSDGKTTLLHFVVKEVVRGEGKRFFLNRNPGSGYSSGYDSDTSGDPEREYMILGLPAVGGVSTEFPNVKIVAALNLDALSKKIPTLAAQLTETQKTGAECEPNLGFAKMMKLFLGTAVFEMKSVEAEHARVMEIVKSTADFYEAGSNGANPLDLFAIVRDFLAMVDRVCVEIARNVQNRRQGSSFSDSPSPGSPRVFLFPKLPANFSDSENDSTAR